MELIRRLSAIEKKRELRDAEDIKLTQKEEESVADFFETEMKNRDIEDVKKVYEALLSAVSNDILK